MFCQTMHFMYTLAILVGNDVCLQKPCQPKSVLRGNGSCTSKTLSQNPCHLCPPYLPIMWCFSPFQVNFFMCYLLTTQNNYSFFLTTWKAHKDVDKLSLLLVDQILYTWTSGIYIRLSNNFAKRAGNGVPSPTKN